jgi:hypothetical protein
MTSIARDAARNMGSQRQPALIATTFNSANPVSLDEPLTGDEV